jgi:hypothetical protein
MTEEEWLGETTHAQSLVYGLLKPGKLQRTKAGKRRLRLFACACCRAIWRLLEEPILRQAVEAAEQFAEGLIERAELQALVPGVQKMMESGGQPGAGSYQAAVGVDLAFSAMREPASAAAFYMTAYPISQAGEPDPLSNGTSCHLLREVFGNPFHPTSLERETRTRTVVSLAQAAYDDRQLPSGHLDAARLAVLSDALEEAGAASDLLKHLRSPGPHVRGCWALDLLLGKG